MPVRDPLRPPRPHGLGGRRAREAGGRGPIEATSEPSNGSRVRRDPRPPPRFLAARERTGLPPGRPRPHQPGPARGSAGRATASDGQPPGPDHVAEDTAGTGRGWIVLTPRGGTPLPLVPAGGGGHPRPVGSCGVLRGTSERQIPLATPPPPRYNSANVRDASSLVCGVYRPCRCPAAIRCRRQMGRPQPVCLPVRRWLFEVHG